MLTVKWPPPFLATNDNRMHKLSGGPLAQYQADLRKPDFTHDPSQERVVHELQGVYTALTQAESSRANSNLLGRVLALVRQKDPAPVRGLYLWGGVGRGKTYLMDAFYESLPFERKMRVHFHRFMRHVHGELKALGGTKNPLERVAERLAARTRVICFDEFFVADIADAMILGGLFECLFARQVTLVATSNIVPDDLYKDGLQRQRFLPAIDLINQHTRVIHLDGDCDYRLRLLEQAELYHFPLDAAADTVLAANFASLAPEAGVEGLLIEVVGRAIPSRCCADDVVWFEFDALCDGPRSQNDYIELAMEYHAVLISNVPVLTASEEEQARRFINLVDEFYDRNVKLVISAAAAIEVLYQGTRLQFEFARTASRLREMQSHEYLARQHRP